MFVHPVNTRILKVHSVGLVSEVFRACTWPGRLTILTASPTATLQDHAERIYCSVNSRRSSPWKTEKSPVLFGGRFSSGAINGRTVYGKMAMCELQWGRE